MQNTQKPSSLRPIGKIVCWACGSSEFQLFRCDDKIETKEMKNRDNGDIVIKIKRIKSKDYVCVRCRFLGSNKPPVEDVSTRKYE